MIPFHGNQYPGQGGHYESWFVRANDPYRRRALWIRYTQFIAADGGRRLGEIWAVWFDGERAEAEGPAPKLGEHSREVLREAGYSEGVIDSLWKIKAFIET